MLWRMEFIKRSSTIEIPAQDRFQVVTEHPQAGLIYDPELSWN